MSIRLFIWGRRPCHWWCGKIHVGTRPMVVQGFVDTTKPLSRKRHTHVGKSPQCPLRVDPVRPEGVPTPSGLSSVLSTDRPGTQWTPAKFWACGMKLRALGDDLLPPTESTPSFGQATVPRVVWGDIAIYGLSDHPVALIGIITKCRRRPGHAAPCVGQRADSGF